MVVTYVCLRCVVSSLSVVSPLARLWEIKGGWRWSKMAKVERCFYCSMEYGLLLVLQDSWSLGLLVWRRNGVARCWDGSVCCGTCEGLCLESPCSFVSGILGRVGVISINVDQRWKVKLVSRAELRSDRHSQFWGYMKWCLWKACWMHLIHIQLGFLVRNP